MVGRLLGLLIAATVAFPACAVADPVLVMGHNGHVTVRNDPFLDGLPITPAPAGAAASSAPPRATHRGAVASAARAPSRTRRAPQPTMASELTRLYRTHQIASAEYHSDSASWNAALATEKRLGGTRATELEAVIENLHGIAAAGELTPSRLPVLFLTLNNNRQWWSSGPIPYPGEETEFSGSQLVWEYYAGQGLELQVLASFGRADGMYTAGLSEYPQMRQLLSEIIPLAVNRGGGIAWEYYFHFDGGNPPWVSAMAQGTGIEALTRAAEAFGPGSGTGGAGEQPSPGSSAGPTSGTYLQIAQHALGIFNVAPPVGVAVPASHGTRYLQYSFAPGVDIINAFLQSLIGLYDYAHVSGNAEAQRLFAAGNSEAMFEVPSYDTGAWSLYQPGLEDNLNYHELVTGFLEELCSRTNARVYCTTAQHFQSYLKTPPALTLLTTAVGSGANPTIRFRLSKYSHVGIVLLRGQNTVYSTSGYFAYGVDGFSTSRLAAGTYTVRLAGTDLAGNFNRVTGTLHVS